ncbi:MAG: PIN domain-containing protein [Spirochaetales bacterium]|nr:PIN domain-containing protein [Spirochaetales bacterium]
MISTLIDAGPLIALFDKSDRYHERIKDFLEGYQGELITTWPVLTEALHMLGFSTRVQQGFLEWNNRGGLTVYEELNSSLKRIEELTRKYNNVPMDLADATLVVISEKRQIKNIITIDSDYYIYRTMKKEILNNIFL